MKNIKTSVTNLKNLIAVAGLLLSCITVSAQFQPGVEYEIVSVCSGMLLEVQGWETTNGAPVDQYVGTGGRNQHWILNQQSDSNYQILNANSGRALEVYNQSQDYGAPVDQWDWWIGANQEWYIAETGLYSGNAPIYQIFNFNSGLALDVAGEGVGDFTGIDQWDPSNLPINQQWLILPFNGPSGPPAPTPDPGGLGDPASTFHGFNWADRGDNFQDGPLVLDGMSSFALLSESDDYFTVQGLTDVVLGGFGNAGANTIRIPINPATVIGGWWQSYQAVIDEATSLGWKVILATWNRNGTGVVDDEVSFYQMWDIVIQAYNGNGNVYFEILNEPHGYTASDWGGTVTYWLARYTTVPHGRVLVGGTDFDEHVPAIASEPFVPSDCLFSVHDYGPAFKQNNTSDAFYYQDLAGKVGNYVNRCVLTEFGAAMTGGPDYSAGDQGDPNAASMIGFCNYCRNNSMGSIYWNGVGGGGAPGAYSMFTLNSNNSGLNPPENPSGLSLVQFGWGF